MGEVKHPAVVHVEKAPAPRVSVRRVWERDRVATFIDWERNMPSAEEHPGATPVHDRRFETDVDEAIMQFEQGCCFAWGDKGGSMGVMYWGSWLLTRTKL